MPTAEAPVQQIKRQSKELDSRSIPIQQAEKREFPPLDAPKSVVEDWLGKDALVVPVEGTLHPDYAEALAFEEEPVKILIHRSTDKNPALCTDYIASNGTPAEMLFRNGWVPIGYLPRGIALITKRKYVGVLARAKQDTIRTEVTERPNEDPSNKIDKSTSQVFSFSVLEDRNPKGSEWLQRLVNQRG